MTEHMPNTKETMSPSSIRMMSSFLTPARHERRGDTDLHPTPFSGAMTMATISTLTLDLLVQWCIDDLTDSDAFGSIPYLDRTTGELNELFVDPNETADIMGDAALEIHGNTEQQLRECPESLVRFENPLNHSLICQIKGICEKNGQTLTGEEDRTIRSMARALHRLNDGPFYDAVRGRLRSYGFEAVN